MTGHAGAAPISPPDAAAPAIEYQRRRDARARDRELAARRVLVFSYLRVAAFVLVVVAGWLAARGQLAPAWPALPVALFLVLVIVHDRVHRREARAARALGYYERALARLDGAWVGRGTGGERYQDEAHPYARDLDLFGRGSLFELLCSARTRAGEDRLAAWLRAPAAAAEVRARQAAVRELGPAVDLREALWLDGADVRAEVDPERLGRWGAAPPVLARTLPWLGVGVVTVAAVVVIAGWLVGRWGLLPVALLVLAEMGIFRLYGPRVAAILDGVDRPGRELGVLAAVLGHLERQPFVAAPLRALAARLVDDEQRPASRQIARLSQLIDWANAQRNQFFILFGFLLLWPIHFAYAIEGWRRRSGRAVAGWLEVVGELEALLALAGYSYEHPGDPFPDVVDGSVVLDGAGLGHPLLPAERCVRNDVYLGDGGSSVMIVSGSNMSGKSTLLRTVGINVVLALAGAPVRATRLALSPLMVGATLRIQDSLAEGASRFYAEITRLRLLVDLAGATPPLLFLLDEILAGTNSHDRRIGAEAVVRGLGARGAIGLVTTHDLALTELCGALPGARNVHFEDQIVDGELRFDYRMRAGVVTHSNAIALMRAVGLEV